MTGRHYRRYRMRVVDSPITNSLSAGCARFLHTALGLRKAETLTLRPGKIRNFEGFGLGMPNHQPCFGENGKEIYSSLSVGCQG